MVRKIKEDKWRVICIKKENLFVQNGMISPLQGIFIPRHTDILSSFVTRLLLSSEKPNSLPWTKHFIIFYQRKLVLKLTNKCPLFSSNTCYQTQFLQLKLYSLILLPFFQFFILLFFKLLELKVNYPKTEQKSLFKVVRIDPKI